MGDFNDGTHSARFSRCRRGWMIKGGGMVVVVFFCLPQFGEPDG